VNKAGKDLPPKELTPLTFFNKVLEGDKLLLPVTSSASMPVKMFEEFNAAWTLE
jgi:hypothetical protein